MRQNLLLVTLIVLVCTPAFGLDTKTRLVGPVMTWEEADLARFNPEWVQVKFVEGSDVVLMNGKFGDQSGLDLSAVNTSIRNAMILDAHPTFRKDRTTLRAWKALGETRYGKTGPDLSLWFNLRVAGGRAAVASLINELNSSPAVEIAHPIPIVEPARLQSSHNTATPNSSVDRDRTPDFTDQQDYLFDTPVGLDAPSAWALPGGYGETMKFIDVELCWTEDHEDFAFENLFYEGGTTQDPSYESHGTSVLGEVVAQHNGYGVSGFSPAVDYGVVAIDLNLYPDVAQYFQEALDELDAGDVWLIELQMYPTGRDATPMEWLQVNYDVIWTSSWAREVVCVEAGANGSQDLDDPSWGGVFDRNQRDSGAIMVGAGTPTGRVAEYFTNFGSRMDVHAWGSEIVTTGGGNLYDGGTLQTRYTNSFGGTSGASPMIVGAGLCLQGIAKSYLGEPL
ncbi:S8 family serine peptidase, partial [Candidatus Eisenbacteria bacterium]